MRQYSHYIGVDPGFKGAIACLNNSATTAKVWMMPVVEHDGKHEMDLQGLKDIFQWCKKLPDPTMAIEWPVSYPGTFGNVARDAENFGRGKGYLHAFAFLVGFPTNLVSPAKWKGRLALPGKAQDAKSERARAWWVQHHPQHEQLILGPRGGLLDGPLDALLIAEYARLGDTQVLGWKGGKKKPTYAAPF